MTQTTGNGLLFAVLSILSVNAIRAAADPPSILYKFTGGSDGANPQGPLTADNLGNLYGSAQSGGLGYGAIFKLAPPAISGGSWTESVLYTFTAGADGAAPAGGLALDASGNLYGVTEGGASVVFEVSPPPDPAGTWKFSVIYTFPGNGVLPNPVVLDSHGNLYGTTQYGGGYYFQGEAYQLLKPAVNGNSWTFTNLHNFQGYPTDGAYPASSLTLDSLGNLFGTTSQGGPGRCFNAGTFIGCGTVFEVARSSAGWNESSIYNFNDKENNMPFRGLVIGRGHRLYGTATYDAFQLTPHSGQAWEKETIYTFTEGISGTIPNGNLIVDEAGKLYGNSSSSGLSGYSTAFQLSPPASTTGKWTETTLASFGQGFNTDQPNGGLVFGKSGALYGVTAGNGQSAFGYIFRVAP